MNKPINEALLETLNMTLESVAFLFIDPLEDIPNIEEWSSIGVAISYSSDKYKGSLYLFSEKECLETMCENVMGAISDDDDLLEKSIGAFKEVLNIVAGNFLTTCFGEEIVFDLGIPEQSEPLLKLPTYSNWVCVEETPFLIALEEKNG